MQFAKKSLPVLAGTLALTLLAACGGTTSQSAPSQPQVASATGNGPASASSTANPDGPESGQASGSASRQGSGQGNGQGNGQGKGNGAGNRPNGPDAVAGATQNAAATPPGVAAADIGLEAARNAALAEAGLSAGQVQFTEESSDWDNGLQVYEFEFVHEGTRYDCEVNGADGSVLRFRSRGSTSTTSIPGILNTDEVKTIALNHAGIDAANATFTKVSLEHDSRSQSYYEVEFYSGNTEYDYKIFASSGEILSSEKELDDRH